MTSPFACDLETFKHMVADFTKAVKTDANEDEIEAAWKCLGLHYLNCETDAAGDIIAVSYLKYASRRYIEREAQNV